VFLFYFVDRGNGQLPLAALQRKLKAQLPLVAEQRTVVVEDGVAVHGQLVLVGVVLGGVAARVQQHPQDAHHRQQQQRHGGAGRDQPQLPVLAEQVEVGVTGALAGDGAPSQLAHSHHAQLPTFNTTGARK
jgi:hypothetical protein